MCAISSKVRLYHLVLIVTRQRVLLFSPLGVGVREEGVSECVCVCVCVCMYVCVAFHIAPRDFLFPPFSLCAFFDK